MTLSEIDNVTDYLKIYGNVLADKIQQEAKPLFNPGQEWDPKMENLIRKPFPAQGDAIMGVVKALEKKNSVLITAECGVGKSLISIASTYISKNGKGPARTLIMCPGHLVQKTKKEVEKTVPDAKAMIVRKLEDITPFKGNGRPEQPEFVIMSKDKAKLGYRWRHAVIQRLGSFYCPKCGALLVDKDGVPATEKYFVRNKRKCQKCDEQLWQADSQKLRRVALSEYIKKHLNGYFDFFIADEVHELKGGSTAQGNSFGALASACKKTIALTGTLIGGYADDIFYVLYRLSPDTMQKEDIGYNRIGDWMSRYGVLEKITRSYGEDNVLSKGRKSSVSVRKKPGLSPMVFCNHLLGKCAFLHLSDIALDLPPIIEQVIQVSMDPDLEAAYRNVEMELYEAVREALRKGSKALLGIYLNTLLCYPDRPFDNKPIYQNVLHFNGEVEERLITIPPELPKGKTYQKESHLIDLVKNEKRLRRKCFVFCQYTGTKDITARMKDFLGKEGIETEVLRSSVSPEKREEWVANKVKQGVDCIVANPKLVETGLDLLDFPTLIFFQTGYSIFTLRQASRRSWRIGQNREVKVYYFFYEGTMQERAMQLMGSKLEASLAIEGKFSDEGLLAMTQGEDMTTLMAKALVDGLQVEGAEQIWKKINEANQKKVSVEMPEELDEGPLKDKEQFSFEGMEEKVVYVDFITFRGRRKNIEKLAVKADELDEVIKGKEVGSAQLALFG